mgnify:FL=1
MKNGIAVGDRVRYESAAGTIRGEVTRIALDMNAANQLVPWLTIEFYNKLGKLDHASLCGTEDYLKMMKFRVNFRG